MLVYPSLTPQAQFCTTNAFDDDFFCMVEENYDLLTPLDLRQYSGVFSALGIVSADPRRYGGALLRRIAR